MDDIGARHTIVKMIREMLGRNESTLINDDGQACISESLLISELSKSNNINYMDIQDLMDELTEVGIIKVSSIENSKDRCVALNDNWTMPSVADLKAMF